MISALSKLSLSPALQATRGSKDTENEKKFAHYKQGRQVAPSDRASWFVQNLVPTQTCVCQAKETLAGLFLLAKSARQGWESVNQKETLPVFCLSQG